MQFTICNPPLSDPRRRIKAGYFLLWILQKIEYLRFKSNHAKRKVMFNNIQLFFWLFYYLGNKISILLTKSDMSCSIYTCKPFTTPF